MALNAYIGKKKGWGPMHPFQEVRKRIAYQTQSTLKK